MNVKRKQTFLISAFLAICGTIGAQETPAALRLTPKRLTNITDSYPMLSPDGSKIVFESNRSGSAEIYVINTGGKGLVQLTSNKASNHSPIWSPDGKKILFSSNRAGPANIGQLYVINPDGSGLQRITDGPGSFVQPSWSRDGKKIFAHQHWETEEFGNLVEFDVPDLK